MRVVRWLSLVLVLVVLASFLPQFILGFLGMPRRYHAFAQPLSAQQLLAQSLTGDESAAIRAVLTKQTEDWNRGDLDAFATGYKNSPDILFIGRKIRKGYAQMLEGYKSSYSTPAKMGKLSFTNLEVQPLDALFVTVTGHFALARTAEGGGDAAGSFLLVMERTPAGWKIVRDDTAADPPPVK